MVRCFLTWVGRTPRAVRCWFGGHVRGTAGAARLAFGAALALFPVASSVSNAGNTPIADATAMLAIANHRAVYDLSLASATHASGVAALSGRMVLKVTGAACRGWRQEARLVTRTITREGAVLVSDIRADDWEADDGTRFTFSSTSRLNGAVVERSAGQIERTGDAVKQRRGGDIAGGDIVGSDTGGVASGGAQAVRDGTAQTGSRGNQMTGSETVWDLVTESPKQDQRVVRGPLVFPIMLQRRILAASTAGSGLVSVPYFDGTPSEAPARQLAQVSLGPPRPDPAGLKAELPIPHTGGLATVTPVSMSHFPIRPAGAIRAPSERGQLSGLPETEIEFLLRSDGVSTGLTFIYPNMRLHAALAQLAILPEPDCPDGAPKPSAKHGE